MQYLNLAKAHARRSILALLAIVLSWGSTSGAQDVKSQPAVRPATGLPQYSFAITADMRSYVGPAPKGKRYFDGACEALREVGPGEFMLGPGDCDPPGPVRATIDRYLGQSYPWYPVLGNHETEKSKNVVWVRDWARAGIPGLVRSGPPGAEETTYSFDFGNSHVVMLNQYFDGRSDAVRGKEGLPEATLQWLAEDLSANRQPLVWVVGHKPIESLPDMDSGRVRHAGESVSANKARLTRFLDLLTRHKARAYICGHTHNASVAKIRGIWQLDAGHARGAGDTGAPSTFMKVRVSGTRTWVDVYRADPTGSRYSLRKSAELEH